MKRASITIRNLSLQFDHDLDRVEDMDELARSIIELVNLSLQREPYDVAAQLITPLGKLVIVTKELDEDCYDDKEEE